MIGDLPPKLWLPPKPALIRPAPERRLASILPGLFPAGALASAAPAVNPAVRYVGQYNYTYSSTATQNTVIPAADFQLAGVNKQLAIIFSPEVEAPAGVLIDSVSAPALSVDVTSFMHIFGGPRVGASDVTVTLNLLTSVTESGAFHVFEVTGAAPLHEGFANASALALASQVIPRFLFKDGLGLAGAFNITDTATFTWTNITEDADADVGTYRLSSAHDLTPAVADTYASITAATSSGVCQAAYVSVNPQQLSGIIRGGQYFTRDAGIAGTTSTYPAGTPAANHTGAGSFKLVVFVGVESDTDISSVTYDGVAMTQIGSVANTGASPDIRIKAFATDITQADPDNNIVVNMAASVSTTLFVRFWRLYGVGSVGAAGSQQGNAAGASFTVDVNQGGLIIGMTVRGTDTQTTTWTGVTEMSDYDAGPAAVSMASQYNCAAETGRTIQATGSASGQYATLAIPFNP